VSPSTASRAINGSSRRVTAENEQRVREAAHRLGYAVDLRAQATARRRSDLVVVVVESLTDVMSMRIAEGIRKAADDGHTMIVAAFPLHDGRARERMRMLRGQRPRALFVIAAGAAVAPDLDSELAACAAHTRTAIIRRDDIDADDAPRRGREIADLTLSG